MELKDRVKKARTEASLSQAELADRVGMGQASLSDLEKGKTSNSRYLIKIASICGVSPIWLQTGKGDSKNNAEEFVNVKVYEQNDPLDDDEVEVPIIEDVELSAGYGRIASNEFKSRSSIRFGKTELTKMNVSFPKAVCVKVSGDSMEPFIPDGAIVGIDTNQTNIIDGKVYAVVIDNELARVKQLYREIGNRVKLRSFNQTDYKDEIYNLDDIKVVGKLFWSSMMWD